jgi:hypothetical protein
VNGTALGGNGTDHGDGIHHLAKVRVAGSNPVFRLKKRVPSWTNVSVGPLETLAVDSC